MSPDQDRDSGDLNQRSNSQYERLQNRLADYGDEDVVEVERMGETLGDIEKEERYKLAEEDANELLSFYITTAAMIEQESALIINAYVFDFGMIREGSLEFIEENFTQKDREDMLYYLGLIDSGLKGELARVRKRRNEVAHSSQHDKIDDIQRVQNNIKRAKEAKDNLKSLGLDVERRVTGGFPEEEEGSSSK